MQGLQSAERLFTDLLAGRVRPPPAMSVSQWLSENIVLVDGAKAGELWSAEGAPYLVEIADCLSDDHPCNTVTVRKSQQSGVSILALGWCCYIAEREPANTLYGVPGIDALKDLNNQKLQPLINAWQKHIGRAVFAPSTSRSGEGSTTFEKKFANSYLALGNANSIMDLSSKTTQKGVKDELSKWSLLQNGADPETLYFGRFTAFRRTKDYKILEISTPEVDTGDDTGKTPGHCRIDLSFKRSDQRYWNVPCPECGGFFVHSFARLKIDYASPHRSVYACDACGHHISEAERVPAVRSGLWVPSVERDGLHRGYHVDAFISLMMSYEAIAEDAIKAENGTEKNKKDFSNVTLGLPYKFCGEAPDHKALMERREQGLVRFRVPARGLLLSAAADVQMRGIWYEVIALAPNRETWTVDCDYIEGDTAHPDNPVFVELRRRTLDKRFPDAFGRTRSLDTLAVDSGYRSNTVYAWVRANQRIHPLSGKHVVLAVKGVEGWYAPAVGAPSLQDIDLDGKRTHQGCTLWPVGTWSLKASFYSDLHKRGMRSGELIDPDGYCHFGDWLGEGYFKQITNEHLADIKVHGKVVGQKWQKGSDNHWLDCRIYNLAAAEYLGLSSHTPDDWAALAKARGMPDELTRVDLFTPKHTDSDTTPAESSGDLETAPSPSPPEPEPAPSGQDWIGPVSDWF